MGKKRGEELKNGSQIIELLVHVSLFFFLFLFFTIKSFIAT